jgi:hypothetical protein
MKVDLYTKTILTIIAGALIYLCYSGSARVVKAQEVQRVFVMNSDIGKPIPITADPPISVWIGTANGAPLPVKIVSEPKSSK